MKQLVLLLVFIFFGGVSYANGLLKVGVLEAPPFVMKDGPFYTGIAIDLWDEIAIGLQQPYIFVEVSFSGKENPFDVVQNKEVDVLVGPFSVTDVRYKKADFTFPFYIDQIVAIAPYDYIHNALRFVKMFFYSVGIIIVTLFLFFAFCLHLIWYYERKKASKISSEYKEGVARLFWIHILPGHRMDVPKTLAGKTLILIQTVGFYLILMALNTAFFSFMTVALVQYANPIQNISDLEGLKVGVEGHSKVFMAAKAMELNMRNYSSIGEGLKAVENGKIQVFLQDLSYADYYLKAHPEIDLTISPFRLGHDLYVFATPLGSDLVRRINEEILALRDQEVPEKICREYLRHGVKGCKL